MRSKILVLMTLVMTVAMLIAGCGEDVDLSGNGSNTNNNGSNTNPSPTTSTNLNMQVSFEEPRTAGKTVALTNYSGVSVPNGFKDRSKKVRAAFTPISSATQPTVFDLVVENGSAKKEGAVLLAGRYRLHVTATTLSGKIMTWLNGNDGQVVTIQPIANNLIDVQMKIAPAIPTTFQVANIPGNWTVLKPYAVKQRITTASGLVWDYTDPAATVDITKTLRFKTNLNVLVAGDILDPAVKVECLISDDGGIPYVKTIDVNILDIIDKMEATDQVDVGTPEQGGGIGISINF